MEINEKYYWAFFLLVEKLKPKSYFKIVKHFKFLEKAWNSSLSNFIEAGITYQESKNIIDQIKKIDIEKEKLLIDNNNLGILTIKDVEYPRLLKEIYSPPPILFYKGDISLLQEKHYFITIVGTRKNTLYSKQITQKIIDFISQYKVITVSGLAFGIDTIVHKVSLENKIKTIAVVGSSLLDKKIYPQQNSFLAKQIEQNGLLLSPFHPTHAIFKANFPQRNRILAGLSKATIVIEAPEKSGALNTAYHALYNNREVLAVPHDINRQNSAGTNNLIKKGAGIITKPEDIIEYLDYLNDERIEPKNKPLQTELKFSNPLQKQIIDLLNINQGTADWIAENTNKDITEINTELTELEIKGIIAPNGGIYYIK